MSRKSVFVYCAKHGAFDGDFCKDCKEDLGKDNIYDVNVSLRAEVERLTRDLAEVIHARDGWESEFAKVERGYQEAQRKCDDLQAAHDADCELALELVELRRKCGEWAPYVDHAGCPRIAAEMWEEAEK